MTLNSVFLGSWKEKDLWRLVSLIYYIFFEIFFKGKNHYSHFQSMNRQPRIYIESLPKADRDTSWRPPRKKLTNPLDEKVILEQDDYNPSE